MWLDFAGKSARATQKSLVIGKLGVARFFTERGLAQGIRTSSHWKLGLLMAKKRRD
jgi:hypothetical protein